MIVAAWIAAACGGIFQSGAPVGASALIFVGAIASLFFATRARDRDPAQGTVSVDEEGLAVAERPPVPRADVAHAFADEERASVWLKDGTQLDLVLPSATVARELVDALVGDAPPGVVAFPIGSRARVVSTWLAGSLGPGPQIGAMAMGALSAWMAWVMALGVGSAVVEAARRPGPATFFGVALASVLAILSNVVFLSTFWRRRVVVGSDGVVVRGLFRQRYLPYASIREVIEDDHGVRLALRDGGQQRLPATPGGEALGARVRGALAAHRAGSAGARFEELARGEQTVAAWRRELEKIAHHGDGYRDEARTSEALAAVAEDSAVAVDRRVGAALVLAARGDESAKRRVRFAASACADDDLREALEQAAEGEVAEGELARAARKVG
jgi:hypothetical protein